LQKYKDAMKIESNMEKMINRLEYMENE